MKVSVMCSLYIGERPVELDILKSNKLYYFEKQLEYLKKYEDSIYRMYFIVTFQNDNLYNIYFNQLKSYESDIIKIYSKDNLGGSYSSWKYGLNIDNGESDYVIMIEDDYVVYDKKSIDDLISIMKSDSELFFCCGLWSTRPMNIMNVKITGHAAISLGIIDNKEYNRSGLELRITEKLDRNIFFLNQLQYLEPFREAGYKMMDITKTHSSMFSNGVNDIREYGIKDGDIIFYPLTKQ